MLSWPKHLKKIIHMDMDAFYASIEQRDNPRLRGKPVVVGGSPKSRGVVATASYEARKFGIRSAMSSAEAYRRCPQAAFLSPDFEKYSQESSRIMSILRQHTDLVEPVSLDEAYLDVTRHRFGIEDPSLVASVIKQNIFAATGLTASAGVAPNLFLSKIASDMKKPNGLVVVVPGQVQDFLKDLSVRRIPGVGPVTEKTLAELKIFTCADVLSYELSFLVRHLGKWGAELYRRAMGEDDREVIPNAEPKQYGAEETFARDTKDMRFLQEKLEELLGIVWEALEKNGYQGRTVTLKIKYHDFQSITRSLTLKRHPKTAGEVLRILEELLKTKTDAGKKPVRLVGVSISGLKPVSDSKKIVEPDLFLS